MRPLAAVPSTALPVLPPSVGAGADKYRFRLAGEGLAYAVVEQRDQELVVTATVPAEGLPDGCDPWLEWGMFRTLGSPWQHPAEVVPPGSKSDAASGAMRTPLAYDKRRDVWEGVLRIKRRLAPVQLAFSVHLPSLNLTLRQASGAPCVVPVGMGPGRPEPLGPSLVEVTSGSGPDASCSINFAVFSRHAAALSLVVLRPDGSGYLEVVLDPGVHRTGDVWHVELRGLRNVGGLAYGWRAAGDKTWADGGAFHPAYVMLDPYCPRAIPVTLPQAAYDAAPLLPPQGRLPGPVLLGSLSHMTEAFDWGGRSVDGPRRSLEETVLLEVDVGAFTTGPDAERLVPPEHRGTYLGVIDRLPDILASGATAVVLDNVFLSSLTAAPPPLDPDGDEPASVAWPTGGGELRRPLSFFAPEVALVAGGDPLAASSQLKALVAALHDAGLEVLLEAEFCLTAEVAGGPGGRLQSVAGLDGDMYVRGGGGPRARGVLNTGQVAVRRLVRDALRHWAAEYRVDGFLLANAENLAQDALGGVRDSPPLLEELAADPVLRDTKVVAAGGDGSLLPRGGVRGIPHYGALAEWNLRFPRDVVALLRDNTGGILSAFATRLVGSPDLTAARLDADLPAGLGAGRRPGFSVNALSAPNGPALLSVAGGDWDLERGEVVARSLLVALAVAQGTPALSASVLARAGLRRFAAEMLRLRGKYRHLLAPPMLDLARDITWHDAYSAGEPDWSGEAAAAQVFASNYIGFSVRGTAPGAASTVAAITAKAAAAIASAPASPSVAAATARAAAAASSAAVLVAKAKQQAVYVGFNPNPEAVAVNLPPLPPGMQWRRLVDTSRLPPEDIVPDSAELLEREYILAPGAALVLDATRRPPAPAGPSAAQRASQVYDRMSQPQ